MCDDYRGCYVIGEKFDVKFDVTVFDVTVFDVTVFDVTVFDVPVFDVNSPFQPLKTMVLNSKKFI